MILLSLLFVQWWPNSVFAFTVAVAVLDVGVQATQTGNFAQIYALDDTAHSRINTVYMTAMFIGGAVGTFSGVLCWSFGGWPLVCWQLLLWCLLTFALVLRGLPRRSAGSR
jgi:hypothetical protein